MKMLIWRDNPSSNLKNFKVNIIKYFNFTKFNKLHYSLNLYLYFLFFKKKNKANAKLDITRNQMQLKDISNSNLSLQNSN